MFLRRRRDRKFCDIRLRVSTASGSERGFRRRIDGASLATARGTDPEVVRTDRNFASPRPIFVQTLTASGPVWRLTNSRDQSGPQRALKRHREDRNIIAGRGVYCRRNIQRSALTVKQEVEVYPQRSASLINYRSSLHAQPTGTGCPATKRSDFAPSAINSFTTFHR